MAYATERKEAILKKFLPPINKTVATVSQEEGISEQTLYNWRDKANQAGLPMPRKTTDSEKFSAETKLAIVVETTTLSESELNQYCREKGLYTEQVKQWKNHCLSGFSSTKAQQKATLKNSRADQLKIRTLKKELRRKEKALAETAALLVLRKS